MVNKKITCVVVDDEPIARRGLMQMLSHYPILNIIGEANSVSTWEVTNRNLKPDLVFMDILLRNNNILDYISAEMSNPLMVITTAFPQFSLRGYEYNALDYLLKPIAPQDLERSVMRAYKYLIPESSSDAEDIFLKVKGKYQRLFYKDILFLEGMQNYVIIHTNSQKLVIKATMHWFENELPKSRFLRVHKSWIINKEKVDVVDNLKIIIDNKIIPISRENKNVIYAELIHHRSP